MGGGIAIALTLAGLMIGALLFVQFGVAPGRIRWLDESATIHTEGFLSRINQLWILILCTIAAFGLGLWDDIKHAGPFTKLIGQFVIALTAAGLADIRVELFIHNHWITTILSAVWIVFLMNAFNFLDNMDGACAGIAAIVTLILFVAAAMSGQVFVGGLALIFVGALLGFLILNFPPAKIFAGDAGSLVIGFFIATLSLKTTYYQQVQGGQWYPVLMPLVVMAVPLYDFISVTVLRVRQGKSPFVGDTQHFSHRLRKRGLSDTQTALTLYLATVCCGLGAIFLYQVNFIGAILIFIQTLMVLSMIAILETTGNYDNDKTQI